MKPKISFASVMATLFVIFALFSSCERPIPILTKEEITQLVVDDLIVWANSGPNDYYVVAGSPGDEVTELRRVDKFFGGYVYVTINSPPDRSSEYVYYVDVTCTTSAIKYTIYMAGDVLKKEGILAKRTLKYQFQDDPTSTNWLEEALF